MKLEIVFDEDRYILLGRSFENRTLVIIFCEGWLMKKEYNFSKMKGEKNPYSKKKPVGINLSPEVIDYFKKMSIENGIPYQTLIDLYLLDCVRTKKKLKLGWAA